MTQVITLIQDALYGSTIKGLDEVISDGDATLCLRRLQRMLDSWGNNTLMQYETVQDSFLMSPTVPTYLTSLLSAGRPITLDSIWVRLNNIDYDVTLIDQQRYDAIPYKPTPAIPNHCFYNASFPDGQFNFYPTPYAAFQCFVVGRYALTGPLALTTDVVLPPGYEKAIVDSLSEDVWTSFKGSAPVPPDVRQMAKTARNLLHVNNFEPLEMDTQFDKASDISNAFIYKGF